MKYIFEEDIFLDKPVEENIHGAIGKRSEFIVVEFGLGKKIKEFKSDVYFEFAMIDQYVNEFHIENVQEVGFAFSNLDLFHKRFKEDLDRYGLILADDVGEVAKHELPDVELFMVFYE